MQKGDGLMYTYRRSGGQERDSAIVDYYDVPWQKCPLSPSIVSFLAPLSACSVKEP